MGWRPRGCAQSGRGREGSRLPAGRGGGPCPRSHSEGCLSWSDTGLGLPACCSLPLWTVYRASDCHNRGACPGERAAAWPGQAGRTRRPQEHRLEPGIPGEQRGPRGTRGGRGCALGALRSSGDRAPLSRSAGGGRVTGRLRRAEAGCSLLVEPSLLWSWAGDRCSEACSCQLPREGVHFNIRVVQTQHTHHVLASK